jgi:hypothetical protein
VLVIAPAGVIEAESALSGDLASSSPVVAVIAGGADGKAVAELSVILTGTLGFVKVKFR